MYFDESESLLHDQLARSEVIEAVDAFLYENGRIAVIHAEHVSKHTGHDEYQVDLVLQAYAARGVLKPGVEHIKCPACPTLTPARKVSEAREDGDPYPCDGPCANDLTELDQPATVIVYRLTAMPT